jgi:hypothetical protein
VVSIADGLIAGDAKQARVTRPLHIPAELGATVHDLDEQRNGTSKESSTGQRVERTVEPLTERGGAAVQGAAYA